MASTDKKKRNTLAGKRNGKSRSAKYYAATPEARKKKLAYNKKYNAKPSEKKRRAELNRYNHKKGTYGNKDKKDASHKNGKIVGMEAESKNRARNGKGSTVRKKGTPAKKRTTRKLAKK